MSAKPRISGILNNCALYCAIPTLNTIIDYFSGEEAKSSLGDFKKNPTFQNIALIKDCFAEFYRFDKAQFNWQHMQSLLQFDTAQFLKQQMVLGPVLRLYLKKKIKQQLETTVEPEQIQKLKHDLVQLSQLQRSGRFHPLNMLEASRFFYRHIGISTSEHPYIGLKNNAELGTDGEGYLKTGTLEKCIGDQIQSLSIYHQNSHFELMLPSRLRIRPAPGTASPSELQDIEIQRLSRSVESEDQLFHRAMTQFGLGDYDSSESALLTIQRLIQSKAKTVSISTAKGEPLPISFAKREPYYVPFYVNDAILDERFADLAGDSYSYEPVTTRPPDSGQPFVFFKPKPEPAHFIGYPSITDLSGGGNDAIESSVAL